MRNIPPIQTVRTVSIILTTIFSLIASPSYAASGNAVPITLGIDPGVLTASSSNAATLNNVSVSHTAGKDSTGTLSSYSVDDSRGGNQGWNLSATFSSLASYTNFVDRDHQTGPFTVSGTYTGTQSLDLTLTTANLTNSTALGHIWYTLVDQTGKHYTSGSVQILNGHQAIGTTGLSFDAPDINYQADTEYHLHIEAIPPTAYTITPGALETVSGSSIGVRSGQPIHPLDANDAISLLIADPNSGDGFYRSSAGLTLSIPAGTRIGSYHGQIVETIQ